MAIAVALDDNLVGVTPEHGASAPTFPPVDLITETHGKLAQIDLPFKGVELPILVRHKTTPSLLPVFFARRVLANHCGARRQASAPAPRPTLEHVAVMQQAVQH